MTDSTAKGLGCYLVIGFFFAIMITTNATQHPYADAFTLGLSFILTIIFWPIIISLIGLYALISGIGGLFI